MSKIYFDDKKIYLIFVYSCVIWGIIQILFNFSPSSYGIALDILGINYHNSWGMAKPIRSDEWGVWTPYTQMAVNNNFDRFYHLPNYSIDLRNFNQLPLWDWAILFKPMTWGYFLFPPSYGFSIFYVVSTLLFILGWQKLIDKLIRDKIDFHYSISIIFSLLIYFTTYIQYWWTTTGPFFAITPWFILSLLNQNRFKYIFVLYISTVWLLSHTYPPIIVTMGFVAIAFILAKTDKYNKEWLLDISIKAILVLIALSIVIFYYWDAIQVMSKTVYPGKRIATGGDIPNTLFLSIFFPFIAQDKYNDLLNLNICEVATGGSFLPILTLFFVGFNVRQIFSKNTIPFLFFLILFALWTVLKFPEWFAKLTFLAYVPANRMLFPIGLILNILSLILLSKGNVKVTRFRFVLFLFFILHLYYIPTFLSRISFGEKSGFELLIIPMMLFIFIIKDKFRKIYIITIALCINMFYSFDFNPIIKSSYIFDVINSEKTIELNNKKDPHTNEVYVEGGFGAVFTGIGVDSFTTVLMQPQLEYFRKRYPEMPNDKFNNIFNRYGHVSFYDGNEPISPYPDQIKIPLKDLNKHK